MDNTSSAIVDVDPALAQQFMGLNARNRHMRQLRVRRYAKDMAEGRWLFNGDCLRFDRTGRLLDGQHRLQAIIDSGTTQRFVVLHGLEPEAQDTIDQQIARSPGDALSLRGYPSGQDLAAMARRVMVHRAHGTMQNIGTNAPSNAELLAFVESTPHLQEAVRFVGERKQGLGRHVKRSLATALFWIFADSARTPAEEFFDGLFSGADLAPTSPILALRNRLSIGPVGYGAKWSDDVVATIFIRAWNAWRERRPLAKVQAGYTADGKLPPLTTVP